MVSILRLFKKKEQSPLIERLIHIDGFLIDLRFDKKPLPHMYKYNGINLHRYMDRLFSLHPISKLNSKQSVALCDIRLKYFEKLVDESINNVVLKEITKLLGDGQSLPSNLLDFG